MSTRPVALLFLTASIVTITACGASKPDATRSAPPSPKSTPFESLPAHEILRSSLDAMRDIGTFRVQVHSDADGKELSADFEVDNKKQCSGLMTIAGTHVRMVITDDATYQKGNRDYWKQNAGKDDAALIAAVSGRWAKSGRINQFAALCTLQPYLDEVGALKDVAEDDLEVSPVKGFNGREVVTVTSHADGSEGAVLVDVAPPHLMRSLSGGPFKMVLSEFDEPVKVEIPRAGTYVDLTQ